MCQGWQSMHYCRRELTQGSCSHLNLSLAGGSTCPLPMMFCGELHLGKSQGMELSTEMAHNICCLQPLQYLAPRMVAVISSLSTAAACMTERPLAC